MAGNRKAAEKLIIDYINLILPDKSNEPLYKTMFAILNDKEFEQFINDLDTGRQKLCVIVPQMSKTKIDVKRNLELGKKIGVEFFQRIWIPENNGVPKYLTPITYLVMDLPLRKASQILDKKISIPEHNNTIDNLTGQPTGDSKGSRVSYPELQVLASMGLDKTITEFYKYRGGDVRGYQAMSMSIYRTGAVSLEEMKKYQSGVESTKTLKTYLTGMHLENTL